MTTKNLEIKTATIEIKVIRVDGHKMTKATFWQIEQDDKSNIDDESVLGWVNDNHVWLIFNVNGKVKKRAFRVSVYSDGYLIERDKSQQERIKNKYDQLFIAT